MIPRDEDLIEDREIDLLIDGELADACRRELLARFETSPDGWRRCALAFLEAQEFRGTVAAMTRELRAAPMTVKLPAKRQLGRWVARAAVLLLAFGVGWIVRPTARESIPTRVVFVPPPMAQPRPSPVRPIPLRSGIGRDRPAPVDYVRGRLEREGYRLEHRLILVPAETKEGRRVTVPVEQIKLRFVGNRAV